MYIYKLLDKNHNLLYIGTTNNVKVRVRNHFSNYINYSAQGLWRDQIAYFKYAEVNCIEADIYEPYLINKLEPEYNDTYNHYDKKTDVELDELDFTEPTPVEELNIDVEYYTELYDQLKDTAENNDNIYTLKEKKEFINAVSDAIPEDTKDKRDTIVENSQSSMMRNLLIFDLILLTGLKTGEIKELSVGDYNPDKGCIYVGDNLREVPLPDGLDDIFVAYYENNNYFENYEDMIDEPLFLSYFGKRLSTRGVQHIFNSLYDDLTVNKLRREFIKQALQETSDYEMVSQVLGIKMQTINYFSSNLLS